MILKIIAAITFISLISASVAAALFSHPLAFFSVENRSDLVFDPIGQRSHPCLWCLRASLADLRTGILERRAGPQHGGPDLR